MSSLHDHTSRQQTEKEHAVSPMRQNRVQRGQPDRRDYRIWDDLPSIASKALNYFHCFLGCFTTHLSVFYDCKLSLNLNSNENIKMKKIVSDA